MNTTWVNECNDHKLWLQVLMIFQQFQLTECTLSHTLFSMLLFLFFPHSACTLTFSYVVGSSISLGYGYFNNVKTPNSSNNKYIHHVRWPRLQTGQRKPFFRLHLWASCNYDVFITRAMSTKKYDWGNGHEKVTTDVKPKVKFSSKVFRAF